MTRPRCLDPGQTYLVTRRCSERRHFLRPGDDIDDLLLYCLARAAEKYAIDIHAFVFMSNHYHLVLSEASDEVQLPRFMAWFNLHTARLINDVRGRSENLWAPGSYNAVVLADEAAVIDKIIYTICNPVAAGLVARPGEWPGLISRPSDLAGCALKTRHPGRLFRLDPEEQMPRLSLTQPKCLGDRSAKAYRRLIRSHVAERLEGIYEKREGEGQSEFLGREAVKKLDPKSRPKEPEEAIKRNPLVACKDRKRRKVLIAKLRAFQRAYREALKSWQAKDRSVSFPRGTYQMRVVHKARCSKGPGVFALE